MPPTGSGTGSVVSTALASASSSVPVSVCTPRSRRSTGDDGPSGWSRVTRSSMTMRSPARSFAALAGDTWSVIASAEAGAVSGSTVEPLSRDHSTTGRAPPWNSSTRTWRLSEPR
ncbi:hypothetical protein COSO111634_29135 [Corallococcus soli]